MTLEGEYYISSRVTLPKINGRNPHDIGRRILLRVRFSLAALTGVAILMTLEGEYYFYVIVFVNPISMSQSS